MLLEYKQYYNEIRQRLPRLGLYSHQDLLRNRERYREEINLLERTGMKGKLLLFPGAAVFDGPFLTLL